MAARRTGSSAKRDGLVFGAIIAALGAADVAAQAWRQAAGPRAHGLAAFNLVFYALALLLLAAAGMRAARATGRIGAGVRAGALAGGLATPVIILLTSAWLLAHQRRAPTAMDVLGYGVVTVLLTIAGAGAGALVALPGAAMGRARSPRREMAATARDADQPEAGQVALVTAGDGSHGLDAPGNVSRQVKKQHEPGENFAIVMILGMLLLLIFSLYLWGWLAVRLHAWALAAGIGLCLAGIGLFAVLRWPRRRHGSVSWFKVGWMALGLGLALSCVVGGIWLAAGSWGGPAMFVAAGVYWWQVLAYALSDLFADAAEPDHADAALPPVIFRDDGQRIVVYPGRRKLAAHAAFCLAVIAVVGGVVAAAMLYQWPWPVALPVGVFGVMGLIGLAPDLARLVHRWPALVVNSEGIVDLASAHVLGVGLIPWGAVNAAFSLPRNRLRGQFDELVIIPGSYRKLLERQPPLKRAVLRLATSMSGETVRISSLLLAVPPGDLAERIADFVQAHAPPGYLRRGDGEPDDGTAAQE